MKRRVAAVSVAVLLTWLWAGPSGAVYLDEDRTIQITGKAMVQSSMRLETSDSNGRSCLSKAGSGFRSCENFTFPATGVGNVIQERNLLDVEFFHDVAGWLAPISRRSTG